jgi:hypothetical protein
MFITGDCKRFVTASSGICPGVQLACKLHAAAALETCAHVQFCLLNARGKAEISENAQNHSNKILYTPILVYNAGILPLDLFLVQNSLYRSGLRRLIIGKSALA